MEAGERELKKAFEEVTTRNVMAVVQFSQDTREMVRKFEIKINTLERSIRALEALLDPIRLQLANIQTRLYRGGTE